MSARQLVLQRATLGGFQFQAGDEAGTFVDLLKSAYACDLKARAEWLDENVNSMTDEEFTFLVKSRVEPWTAEFQSISGTRE